MRGEKTVQVHDLYGGASFAACSELFLHYPLAVTPHEADGGLRSMVLMNHVAGHADFLVLIQASDDLFVIRAWNRLTGISHEIRPEEPVPGIVHKAVTGSMPVPRNGALLGWVVEHQVTALLAVRVRPPERWNDPVLVPEIQVMPMAGTSELLHWPPFAASPLAELRLWDYIDRGQIVDIAPLVTRQAGLAFWVPSPDRRSARPKKGSVVITDDLPAAEYWLPAGVYMDHWALREGIAAPPSASLLALPGVVDLARTP